MKKTCIETFKNFLFLIINGSMKIVYAIVLLLFPVKRNKIFINCFDGKGYGDNPKYIYEALIKLDTGLKFIWLNKGTTTTPKQNILYVKPFSIKAIYHQATSKIWISTVRMPFYSIKREKQIYIHTWHAGLALKRVERECENALSSRYKKTAKHDSAMIDYYISSNKDNSILFLKYFWYQGGKILETGSPRNDIFFDISADKICYLKKKYDLGDYKIAIYAPTFRKHKRLNVYSIDCDKLLITLSRQFGGMWKLIIRLHPHIASEASDFKYSKDIINGSMINDVQELLAVSDILITDYSSISMDYIYTGRPVFIFATDIEDYEKDRNFHINLRDLPFAISTSNEELFDCIKKFDQSEYTKRINKFKDKYSFFGNGKASETIAKLIIEEIIS